MSQVLELTFYHCLFRISKRRWHLTLKCASESMIFIQKLTFLPNLSPFLEMNFFEKQQRKFSVPLKSSFNSHSSRSFSRLSDFKINNSLKSLFILLKIMNALMKLYSIFPEGFLLWSIFFIFIYFVSKEYRILCCYIFIYYHLNWMDWYFSRWRNSVIF